jgi:hexokinase
VVDSLACGHDPFSLFDTDEEQLFAKDVALSLFERSARCAAANILAILRINDTGKTPEKPACVCAEGSLIARSKYFLPFLQKALKEAEEGPDARYVEIVLGHDTTLPGSAVAALLNT